MKETLSKKGFVILYAVLVAAVVAAIGIAVAELVSRQIFLANISRQSQQAYYAANTARECLRYWDSRGYFGEIINLNIGGSLEYAYKEPGGEKKVEDIQCGRSGGFAVDKTNRNRGLVTYTSTFDIGDSGNSVCAQVIVKKIFDPAAASTFTRGQSLSQLIANGYNVSCDTLKNGSNERIVQRTLISQ